MKMTQVAGDDYCSNARVAACCKPASMFTTEVADRIRQSAPMSPTWRRMAAMTNDVRHRGAGCSQSRLTIERGAVTEARTHRLSAKQ